MKKNKMKRLCRNTFELAEVDNPHSTEAKLRYDILTEFIDAEEQLDTVEMMLINKARAEDICGL